MTGLVTNGHHKTHGAISQKKQDSRIQGEEDEESASLSTSNRRITCFFVTRILLLFASLKRGIRFFRHHGRLQLDGSSQRIEAWRFRDEG